jgi:hypothetical protein
VIEVGLDDGRFKSIHDDLSAAFCSLV